MSDLTSVSCPSCGLRKMAELPATCPGCGDALIADAGDTTLPDKEAES